MNPDRIKNGINTDSVITGRSGGKPLPIPLRCEISGQLKSPYGPVFGLGHRSFIYKKVLTPAFHTLLEAKVMAEDYRQQSNAHRPHSSLGYLTPNEFALQWRNNNPGLTKSLAH